MTAGLAGATPTASAHRSDIDGLRALAIGVVVGFHAGFPGFDGGFIGVDVFFVISGYLITGVLLREIEDHGRIRLGRFWARRIRRLLPASTLVVVATLAATVFLLSPLSWQPTAEAGAWAAGYAENVFLAIEEADYFAVETRNPFVHFWSLAIEEQFYVIWPLVMLALSGAAGALRRPGALAGGLVVLTVASFVHSVSLTGADSTWDYYSPLSRGWEFAAGGLLALAAPAIERVRTPAMSVGATVVGAALIAYSLFTLNSFAPFPGVRAVPSVVGTALIIAAHNQPEAPIGRLLGLAPVQWIGKLSYGWYLWHFPFLIIGEQYSQSFGPVRRLVLVLLALVAAAISYAVVENPVRYSERLRVDNPANYALAVGLLAVSLAVAFGAHRAADSRLDDPRYVELQEAAVDFERISDRGCPEGAGLDVLTTSCVWGDPEGTRTLLVLGDSHADQWIPALDAVGQANDIRVLMRTVVACPALPSGPPTAVTTRCQDTQAGQLELIDALEPDAIVVSQWTGSFVGFTESKWRNSVTAFGNAVAERDIGVVWVHDPPSFGTNPLDCLGIRDEVDCIPDRFEATAATEYQTRLVQESLAGIDIVTEFSPVDILCDETACALRIDGDLVYRDSNHLTGTVAATFADDLTPLILAAMA